LPHDAVPLDAAVLALQLGALFLATLEDDPVHFDLASYRNSAVRLARVLVLVLLPLVLAAIALAHVNWRIYREAGLRVRQSEEHFALVHDADLDRAGRRYAVERRPGEEDAPFRRRVAHARARTYVL